MKVPTLLMLVLLVGSAVAGCFGGAADDAFDYVPGENWKPTGNKVVIRMWVEDIEQKEVYPGLEANFWAFCAEPVDPADTYSASVIEYRDEDSKCSTPGPQLRVTQGDQVEIRFENDHFHPHTIHWHGQHVPMEADGVPGVTQDSVSQGGTYKYEFTAKRAGTLWYHCHVDGQFHVMMGLYGVMIVEPQDTRWEPKDIDKEYTWVFSTARREHIQYVAGKDPHADHKHGQACGASGIPGCQNPSVDVTPDVFMLNGVSYPNTMDRDDTVIWLKADERVRIRLVNTGETFETIHFHGHDVLVTHKDGNPLPPSSRYWTETLPIGPAERYDVVLQGDKDAIGAWVAHTHVEGHITNDGQHPGGMHSMIVYEEFEGDLHGFKAELAGGMGPTPKRVVPPDYRHDETAFFGATGNLADSPRSVSREMSDIPVPRDLCLVSSVYFTAHLHGDSKDLAATELDVILKNPALTEDIALTLNKGSMSASWSPAFEDLKASPYTVTISGDTVEASVHISTVIDYFETEQNAKDRGRPCAIGTGDGHDDHAH